MKRARRPSKQTPKKRQITLARQSTALTIAGSDPSGGAGLQADLKAFQQNGVYGTSVVTLLTVQNTQGVDHVEVLPVDLVRRQLRAVLDDIPPLTIKTGALGTPEMVAMVAEELRDFEGSIVVDPVLVSKHGDRLAGDEMVDAYRKHLFPIATLLTPNRFEAKAWLGREIGQTPDDAVNATGELIMQGVRHVLLKAGLIDGDRVHVLGFADIAKSISVPDVPGDHGHGAGCCLSAVIAAQLALFHASVPEQQQLEDAIHFAITAVHAALSLSPPFGKGCRPVEHRVLHMGN